MRGIFGWIGRGAALNENRGGGGPWGGGSGDGGGAGGGSGSGGDGGGDGPPEPPRNPWGAPGSGGGGRRGRGGGGGKSDNVTSFEDWLKRSREKIGRGLPGSGGGGVKRPYWLYGLVAFAAIWILFTSIHRVNSGERGIVTTFGRYERTINPGIAFTWPAPISRFETVQVEEIRVLPIPSNGDRENLILTGDQNVIDLAYQVRWNVSDPQLYLFQINNPDATISEVAESAMRSVVSRVSLEEALGSGRSEIEQRVEQAMQQLLDEYGAGIAIQGVSINQSSPPAAVNDAFLAVSAAQQRALQLQNEARAYALARTAQAQGDAAQFEQIYQQYRAAPEVTRRRMYYETMEEILARTDTTILEAAGVAPYLPLPELQRRQRLPAPPAQPAQPAQPGQQGGQQPPQAQPAQAQPAQGGRQ